MRLHPRPTHVDPPRDPQTHARHLRRLARHFRAEARQLLERARLDRELALDAARELDRWAAELQPFTA